MNPEIEQLKRQLQELLEWKASRERQQISFPLDLASKNSLGVPTSVGAGSSSLTQSVAVSSTPTNIDVPAAYAGSIIISIEGVSYEIPYIA